MRVFYSHGRSFSPPKLLMMSKSFKWEFFRKLKKEAVVLNPSSRYTNRLDEKQYDGLNELVSKKDDLDHQKFTIKGQYEENVFNFNNHSFCGYFAL